MVTEIPAEEGKDCSTCKWFLDGECGHPDRFDMDFLDGPIEDCWEPEE